MRFTELLLASEQNPASVKATGRRRPGRNNQVSPHLIPLLRNAAAVDIHAPQPGKTDPPPTEDGFALVKRIIFWLALSSALWAVIGAVAWAMLTSMT